MENKGFETLRLRFGFKGRCDISIVGHGSGRVIFGHESSSQSYLGFKALQCIGSGVCFRHGAGYCYTESNRFRICIHIYFLLLVDVSCIAKPFVVVSNGKSISRNLAPWSPL